MDDDVHVFKTPSVRARAVEVTLASTLFDLEHSRAAGVRCHTGVKAFDKDFDVWSSGQTIAIACERRHALSAYLIADHLLAQGFKQTASVYIIALPGTTVLNEVHNLLHRHVTAFSPSETKVLELLESTQLLQYFDVAGLAESLSEVSSRLAHDFEPAKPSKSPALGSILFIQGISSTLSSAQRRSGLVQALAVLSSVLRTITHISRACPSCLVLLELDLEVKTKAAADEDSEEIISAFSNLSGRFMRMSPGGPLGRMLEGAADLLVAVHDADGKVKGKKRIAEVVKDRQSGQLGTWAFWEAAD